MTSTPAPPLVAPKDLGEAGRRLLQFSQDRGAFNVASSLALASVDLRASAVVGSHFLPAIEAAVDADPDGTVEDIVSVAFGVGIAIGALAAQQAAARTGDSDGEATA
jgi:hypothetical protein